MKRKLIAIMFCVSVSVVGEPAEVPAYPRPNACAIALFVHRTAIENYHKCMRYLGHLQPEVCIAYQHQAAQAAVWVDMICNFEQQ
jgi:hypothetical protein